jgi:FXSXX-COOH protein
MYSPPETKQRVEGTRHMNSADTNLGIESELIDLSTVSLDRLRGLNSSALREAMHHVLDRTVGLRHVRRTAGGGGGERID